MSSDPSPAPTQEDRQFHTYTTHRIPWFIRLIWIAYWIGLIWYVIAYAIPAAKTYF